MCKRVFDIVVSLIGLLLLLPLFVVVALWIKLDSPGPIFYRQTRMGQYGVPFRIHKFRTMWVNAERAGQLTIGFDPRVTRAGRFLRKFKIDELPQLIDVFFGRMSLVGPRPEVKEFVLSHYPPDVRDKVLSVRPGITDRASIEMIDESEILGRYEDARQAYIDIILPQKIEYYVDYVNNRSFLLDIKLILLTLKKLFLRR